ncbi:MAG: PTS sugar transporter subunit IIA [Verrucomicrobia bacterium]|nr:PTS sugar transporter subunit IIA [Verrucomicrobiota bacterium]
MAISNYLDTRLVLFLETESRDQAIGQLIALLDTHGKLKNRPLFEQSIFEREKVVSTGIGLGVAVPHAKLSGYEDFFIAIGIQKKKGIEWNALDRSPVHFVFLIGGPDSKQTEYLKILSHLTMAIKSEERRKKLLRSDTAEGVLALFAGC